MKLTQLTLLTVMSLLSQNLFASSADTLPSKNSMNHHKHYSHGAEHTKNSLNNQVKHSGNQKMISSDTKVSSHNDMHDMHGMHGMKKASKDRLTPASYFGVARNQPLKPLITIQNMSTEKGVFKAILEPKQSVKRMSDKASPELWLYNGEILPLIEVNAGDKVEITVKNRLNEDTTVHWHGLAIPPSQDGNPQDPIAPNAQRTYEFTTNEDMAGTHWFHPHTHLRTSTQVAKGLAGAFIIKNSNDPLAHIPEQTLFFSDLKLDKNGQIAENDMIDIMNGREGQFALINGQWEPEIELDGTQRWRLINGNSARYLNFSFPKEMVEVYLVATDGGLIESPQQIESLLLTPGERAEIVVTPKSDKIFSLMASAYDRDKMGPVPKEVDLVLAQIHPKVGTRIKLPSTLTDITPLPKPSVTRKVIFSEEMAPLKFLINGQSHDMNRIDFKMNKGEVELWEITNQSHMDHNFHLHGPQFQVIEFENNGVVSKPPFTLFKDTINVRPGETIRVLTQQNHTGIRMFHCHILEHEDAGMMGQVEVL
ncbi:multicopper oxidase family protein [Thorsellia kenyensis]|uniref:Multicopper oxidase family protein n=1 Tax=Thorsellia kenyensis TaxID=1549888 RepID=A0ABV6CC66_9GAMM